MRYKHFIDKTVTFHGDAWRNLKEVIHMSGMLNAAPEKTTVDNSGPNTPRMHFTIQRFKFCSVLIGSGFFNDNSFDIQG